MRKIVLSLAAVFCCLCFATAQQHTYWYKIDEKFDHKTAYTATQEQNLFYRLTITQKGAMLFRDVCNDQTKRLSAEGGSFFKPAENADTYLLIENNYLWGVKIGETKYLLTLSDNGRTLALSVSEGVPDLHGTMTKAYAGIYETVYSFGSEPDVTYRGSRCAEPASDDWSPQVATAATDAPAVIVVPQNPTYYQPQQRRQVCAVCKGSGVVEQKIYLGGTYDRPEWCHECHGHSYSRHYHSRQICTACNGTGYIEYWQ